ncbi:hypothetical protein M0813_21448 [Anaeramoeba flamelloides]|uniref:Uncharacterized protein n=1 Tax=Anaeramoeba flamelloides TaxID=1746091 RepID=A0ABQ8YI58_9EUKA|nr:hypothetical protein M0813_21448 [Anaeramoeba flamelloides]
MSIQMENENENEKEIPQPSNLKGYEPLDFETLQNKNLNIPTLDFSTATKLNSELWLFRLPKSFDVYSLDQKVIDLSGKETQIGMKDKTKEQTQPNTNFLIGEEQDEKKEKGNENKEEDNHFKIINTSQLSKEELEQIVLMLPDLEKKEFRLVEGFEKQFEVKRVIKLPPPTSQQSGTEDLDKKKKKSKKKKKKSKKKKKRDNQSTPRSILETNNNQNERKRKQSETEKGPKFNKTKSEKKRKRKKKRSRKNSDK